MYSHVVPRPEKNFKEKVKSHNDSLPCGLRHNVSIALDNIILHHLQGEIPAKIMGNPVNE